MLSEVQQDIERRNEVLVIMLKLELTGGVHVFILTGCYYGREHA